MPTVEQEECEAELAYLRKQAAKTESLYRVCETATNEANRLRSTVYELQQEERALRKTNDSLTNLFERAVNTSNSLQAENYKLNQQIYAMRSCDNCDEQGCHDGGNEDLGQECVDDDHAKWVFTP